MPVDPRTHQTEGEAPEQRADPAEIEIALPDQGQGDRNYEGRIRRTSMQFGGHNLVAGIFPLAEAHLTQHVADIGREIGAPAVAMCRYVTVGHVIEGLSGD